MWIRITLEAFLFLWHNEIDKLVRRVLSDRGVDKNDTQGREQGYS